ncbi:hypothetical protein IMF27_21840 [Pseudomonas sp. PCH199]|uniref:hypothetical protein n=1 Tax=unclassified Pseudomonas TaxID=196821 RepID=UPI000BD1E62A|nr:MULTISPECIES: hypothetical protein [unclassified Pseudomonas]MCW8277891.1 hypothetical protein [Pseudomonas sp. PCH199]PAM81819.1 hypothetical protein CES87_22275 [Pseudomonas sp. ERMR1:02]
MSAFTFEHMNDLDAEITRSTALFFEADELETLAYGILDAEVRTDEVLKKFSKAKAIADAKRAEATQIWVRARRLMSQESLG